MNTRLSEELEKKFWINANFDKGGYPEGISAVNVDFQLAALSETQGTVLVIRTICLDHM